MRSSRRMARSRCSRKFSSITKNELDFELVLHAAHDFEEFVAGLEEVDELALAAEKRRGRAEVAAHGAADRRNNGRGRRALALRQANAHDPRAHAGDDGRMPDRARVSSSPR